MAHRKLVAAQLEQLKQLVLEGKTPEDISKHFNIAVSSVHNYKRMLKEKGLTIPDVRGKRPTGQAPQVVQTITNPVLNGVPAEPAPTHIDMYTGYMKLVIDTVTIYVGPGASVKSLQGNVLVISC